jgi:hypothetical protein
MSDVDPPHDVGNRQGLQRVTLSRTSAGRCHHCSRAFETLQGAVSHGRTAGHMVEGTYAATYLYAPTGLRAGVQDRTPDLPESVR